jgi:hypothetical protein
MQARAVLVAVAVLLASPAAPAAQAAGAQPPARLQASDAAQQRRPRPGAGVAAGGGNRGLAPRPMGSGRGFRRGSCDGNMRRARLRDGTGRGRLGGRGGGWRP